MDQGEILGADDVNRVAINEANDTTPLVENQNRISATGTTMQHHTKHVCCIYITGFLVFAIIFALMIVFRFGSDLEISQNQERYEDALSGILIAVVAIGGLDQLCLILYTMYKNECRGNVIFSVERVFFLVLGFFSIGSYLIDALTTNQGLCFASYSGLCCVFAALQIFYNYSSDSNNPATHKCKSIAFIMLIVVNLCIWSNIEVNEIYIIFHDTNVSHSGEQPSQGSTSIDKLFDDIAYTIHPFGTPLKIEFFLMALELLASKIKHTDGFNHAETILQQDSPIDEPRTISSNSSSIVKKVCDFLEKITDLQTIEFAVKGVYCLLILLYAFGSVLMVVVAANPDENTMSSFYRFFNSGDLTFDCIQFVFLIITLLATYPWIRDSKMHLENVVFSFCAFANIIYNGFDCYSAFSLGEIQGGANAIITITNTLVQSIYLISLHNDQHESRQKGIKLMYFLLAMNNFGFWMVDSLAQARYPPFTYTMKAFYKDTWWKVINKIVFPFVIFYRFKASMFFFEKWGSREE